MVDRIWLKSYPAGMPAEIDADLFTSIPDVLAKLAVKFDGKPAYHNLGRTMSYAELARCSRDFAAYLQGLPGMAKGDRVAIMSPNLLQYPVALFGILQAGMVVVNVNPMYTPRELLHQLKDSGAKAIVILENFASTLQEVLASTPVAHVSRTQVGDMLPAPKRWIVNFVIKHVKKMVPDWRIEGAVDFPAALARGAAAPFAPKSPSRARTSRSCNTRAAPPAWRRARCSRTATCSPTSSRPASGSRASSRKARRSSSRRCRCITSSASLRRCRS